MRLRPWRFTAARGSHILSTAALYVRLTGDRRFLRDATPQLSDLVERIAQQGYTQVLYVSHVPEELPSCINQWLQLVPHASGGSTALVSDVAPT